LSQYEWHCRFFEYNRNRYTFRFSFEVPLPEQEGPQRGTWQKLEMFGSKELAYAITMHDYELFMAINQVRERLDLMFVDSMCHMKM
jgi:hypothetical protein